MSTSGTVTVWGREDELNCTGSVCGDLPRAGERHRSGPRAFWENVEG